jgi:multidrug resistance efflux pump
MLRYGLPLIAVLMLAFATYSVVNAYHPKTMAAPPIAPPQAETNLRVAAAGLVESSSENISIGTPLAGIAERVYVKAGQEVKAGDPLFTLDDRDTRAELALSESKLAVAREKVRQLESYPRKEEVERDEARLVSAQAAVPEAEVDLANLTAQFNFVKRAYNESPVELRPVTEEEFSKREFAAKQAEARLSTARVKVKEAQANLDLTKAGTFEPEKDVARREAQQAEADLATIKTTLERLTVRAPIAGTVLQVNVRPGEFAQAGPLSTPLIVMGETATMHVRVDVDETEIHRIKAGARARAYLRGDATISTELTFVRFEPLVLPKRSLTGDTTERVDTRVLQVIYRISPSAFPAFVGQQVDVFIDVEPQR